MMGEAGIALLGWLYPDGRFLPRWLKFVLPFFIFSVMLLYWPASPLYGENTAPALSLGLTLFWYFFSVSVMIYRYRHVTSLNQRQQFRWVFLGTMGPLLWFLMFRVTFLFVPALQNEESLAYIIFQISMRVLSIFLFLAFPACLTIAIARYKLFDIDFLINRALVYGALTAILASAFALVLLIFNAILNALAGQQSTLGLVISAMAAGALFQPTRKALQRFVDRAFYHIHIDYLKTPVKAKFKPQAQSDTQTQAPLLFSSYTNLELIGKGGMAEVYRADHPTSHTPVAIKVLLSNLAEDEQFRKRFQREAQTLAGLEHPNIVRIYDYGVENDLYYMVMEYLNGKSLSAQLKQVGQIPLEEAYPILTDVAGALDYAHSFGLIHRDVKPSNVMLDSTTDARSAETSASSVEPRSQRSPRAVLTDFGIAKLSGAHTNITASAVLGTFDYIAPEQIQGAADVDGRADIYALGVMTYQVLTGALPFKRSGTGALLLAHMTAPPPDARDVVPALQRHTATAIQKAMAKKPADRFSTAAEFIQALE
jgi:serine/threonine-protein kinase